MKTLNELADSHKKRQAVIEKNDGKSFHDLQMEREKANPGIHDRECKAADDFGNTNADSHLKKARDHNNPGHLPALKSLLEDFGGNEDKLRESYKKDARFLLNAKPREFRNTAYENSVLSNFRISTQQDQAFLNKFKDYMTTKWKAEGYGNDEQVISDFWEAHPLNNPLPRKQHLS